jgi:hypothetical protein
VQVAKLFFALPAASGFLLAGGAALIAQHLSTRPTQDLDFFTQTADDVPVVRAAFEDAAGVRGWTIERISDTPTFCRLVVHGEEDLLVDLALDSPPGKPPSASFVGPTFAPEELAGRKLLALFDRAAARDFVDVFALSKRYSKQGLLREAVAVDAGFDPSVLAEMFRTLNRYADADLPVNTGDAPALRAFFATWHDELET